MDDQDLSQEQQDSVLHFLQVWPEVDDDTARTLLEQCGWSLDLAIQEHLNQSEGLPSNMVPEAPEPREGVRRRHVDVGDISDSDDVQIVDHQPHRPPRVQHRTGWMEWLYGIAMLPFRFTYYTLMDLVRFIGGMFFPVLRRVTDPESDVTRFAEEYEQSFGEQHPTFLRTSYANALQAAKSDLRFLLVYLHSPRHQDTAAFARNVLGDRNVINFVNSNFLFWGCDVQSGEGYRVSLAMRETAYPFLALICLRESRMMIVLRKEGYCTPDEIIGFLGVAINDNQIYLDRAREERHASQVNAQLRQQQASELEESLLHDRQRQRERDEAERAEQEQREAGERLRHEEEQRLADAQRRKEEIRANLSVEPSAGDAGCVRVSLRYPNGDRSERRFLSSTALSDLLDFAFCHQSCPLSFSVVNSFPRRTIADNVSASFADVTLADVQLEKAVALMIVDNEA